jgi:hypothetical protein
MKCTLDTKLLIVGTSQDISNYDKSFFELKRKEGFKILAYSNAIDYMFSINAPFDYYSFIDPNSLKMSVFDNLDRYDLSDKILITANLYNTEKEFSNYFATGYTCFRLKKHDPINWKRIVQFVPKLNSIFKEYYKLDYKVLDGRISKSVDFSETCYIVRFGHSQELDKFSSYVLPLTFNAFPKATQIDIIGFGQFDLERWYTKNTINEDGNLGLSNHEKQNYIKTYNIFKDTLRDYIIKKDIQLKFIGKSSIFAKHLEI